MIGCVARRFPAGAASPIEEWKITGRVPMQCRCRAARCRRRSAAPPAGLLRRRRCLFEPGLLVGARHPLMQPKALATASAAGHRRQSRDRRSANTAHGRWRGHVAPGRTRTAFRLPARLATAAGARVMLAESHEGGSPPTHQVNHFELRRQTAFMSITSPDDTPVVWRYPRRASPPSSVQVTVQDAARAWFVRSPIMRRAAPAAKVCARRPCRTAASSRVRRRCWRRYGRGGTRRARNDAVCQGATRRSIGETSALRPRRRRQRGALDPGVRRRK